MHTAKTIKAMSDTAARDLGESLAMELMGTDRFKTALADLTGYERASVNWWFSSDGRPPVVALLYMQAEIGRREAQGRLDALREALARI